MHVEESLGMKQQVRDIEVHNSILFDNYLGTNNFTCIMYINNIITMLPQWSIDSIKWVDGHPVGVLLSSGIHTGNLRWVHCK